MKTIKNYIHDYISGFSIQMKIYFMVVAAILLVTVICLYVVRVSVTETLSHELDERVKSISGDVAARTSDLLLTNNIYAMQKLVNDTVENNSDIEYVFILNEDGKMIVDSYNEEEEEIRQELIDVNVVSNNDHSQLMTFDSEKGIIRDAAVPVLKGDGGTARVGLRSDSLDLALSQITQKIFVAMVVLLFISVLIVMSLTKMITKPITRLVNLTKKVADGDLTERIEMFPNDEIGRLTESFNSMLHGLEQAEKTKEEYVKQVITRNRELTLLNNLSANTTSFDQFKKLLGKFVVDLVNQLDLNSATIEAKINNQLETFRYKVKECPLEDGECGEKWLCLCDKQDSKIYNTFPLTINDSSIGKINICSSEKLDVYSKKILMSIGNQLAVTIENNQLWNEIKKKEEIRLMLLEKVMTVQEEERKRIARELHDETSHSLSSILLGLKVLQEQKNPYERDEQIIRIRDLTHQAMEEVHDLAWQLRPSILDKFGLKVAIERHIQEYKKKSSIEFDVIIQGIDSERLTPEIETVIFRIVQESLTNILKYADAVSVSVIIIRNNDIISVIVEDDGIGFDVEMLKNKDPSKFNLGLHGMEERASLLGGTLEIESELDRGTAIMVKIPVNDQRGERYENQNFVS